MEQRVSLITLGVRDLPRAARFYDALGWSRAKGPEGIVAYDLIGQTLGLYPLADLARDMGVSPDSLGHGAATLAHNLREAGEVADLLERAEAAGARILRAAYDTDWGGRVGYFADPDGHVWEIAHNPFSPLSPEGAFRWSGY